MFQMVDIYIINSKIKLLIKDRMINIGLDQLDRILHNLMTARIGSKQFHFNNIQEHIYMFSQKNLIYKIWDNLYIMMLLCYILSNLNYKLYSSNLIHNNLFDKIYSHQNLDQYIINKLHHKVHKLTKELSKKMVCYYNLQYKFLLNFKIKINFQILKR